ASLFLLDARFLHLDVHANGVAGFEAGQALLQVLGLDVVDRIHTLPFPISCSVRVLRVREAPRPEARAGAPRPSRRGASLRAGPDGAPRWPGGPPCGDSAR